MSERRTFHLGIDYGTSASKLVLRDYLATGGERAYLLTREPGLTFRFPSAVAVREGFIVLGVPFGDWGDGGAASVPRDVFESIKMRLAHAVSPESVSLRVAQAEPPAGMGWRELCIISVWWLISEGHRAARSLCGHEDFGLGMTLGVPMCFYRVPRVRDEFLLVARCAWRLYRHHGALAKPVLTVTAAIAKVREAVGLISARPLSDAQIHEWIRSEAEAAVWWAFQSPSVAIGPYGKVDVGAGTTNASLFRVVGEYINGRWHKQGLAFFGAQATDYGMDAVDQALATALGRNGQSWVQLRGTEEGLLRTAQLRAAAAPAVRGIEDALRRSWREASARFGTLAERHAWRDGCRMLMLGGGSRLQEIRERCRIYPWDEDIKPTITQLECPPDLWVGRERVGQAQLPHCLVAYGLSDIRPSVPVASTPDDIPPLPDLTAYRRRIHHEEIYGEG